MLLSLPFAQPTVIGQWVVMLVAAKFRPAGRDRVGETLPAQEARNLRGRTRYATASTDRLVPVPVVNRDVAPAPPKVSFHHPEPGW